MGKNFLKKTTKEIDRDFGKGFSDNIVNSKELNWVGPFKSIYGTHLIKISNITKSRSPTYEEVKKDVLLDYFLEMKQKGMQSYISNLKKEYDININPKFNFD